VCGRHAADVEVAVLFVKAKICRKCASAGVQLVQVAKRFL
jgi:hypothetical protein